MKDEAKNALTQLSDGFAALPDPVQTSLFAAASRMLGSLASFPAAWFRRPVQSFEDTTDARSLVAKGLAQAVVDAAKNDPAVIQAASEAYLPSVVRKVANRSAVMTIAIEEAPQAAPASHQAAPLDDDWMNSFMRFAEDASSERLQALFGKILAGEITNPGSFSPATLRAVSEMTQSVAKSFEWIWSKSLDDYVNTRAISEPGAGWLAKLECQDAGLLSEDAVLHAPSWDALGNGSRPWTVQAGPFMLGILKRSAAQMSIPITHLSTAGRQLGKLLPAPTHEANLRELAMSLHQEHVVSLGLYKLGEFQEVLWTAAEGAGIGQFSLTPVAP